MKKLKHITLLIFVLLSVNLTAQTEESGHPILDDFKVFEISGKVFIDVTISSGNTCNGIIVWRSDDSLNYEIVGEVVGICGNSTSPISYNFTDASPIKNIKSYYKVELGGAGFTNTVSIVLIDTKDFGFQIRPNPANEKAIIYYENPTNEEFELFLFDISGNKISTQKSTNNAFNVDTFSLGDGLYFFSIGKSLNQEKVMGKLMIQH
ncbi:MAG: T9SS type A sorting domain-containing protein [Vicingaceae bacterium]|nr:T9SS type A sorting domain-containing protein [Vicingaceae bacterium]